MISETETASFEVEVAPAVVSYQLFLNFVDLSASRSVFVGIAPTRDSSLPLRRLIERGLFVLFFCVIPQVN